jgi:5-oxoprolinase (ATP-hydrolysing) subunit C
MGFLVQQPGLSSLLVGPPRTGRRAFGLPLGGPADHSAFQLANALVGNVAAAGCLEITLVGPKLLAQTQIAAVVFGAPFDIQRNDQPIEAGTTFQMQPGDKLHITGTISGCRGYLAVGGGFTLPKVQEPLKPGEALLCQSSSIGSARSLGFCTLQTGSLAQLRVLPGPQSDWFTNRGFTSNLYTVSPTSNRMGIRLMGDALSRRAGELVSEAVAPGAVQITNDGQPIVLGVDGQTIGGYPKVAHVVRADLDRLGQLRPGTQVRFRLISQDESAEAARELATTLRNWQTRLTIAAGTRIYQATT